MVDTKELSSDFSGLRYLCSFIDLGSLRNLNGLNNLQNPFFLNKIPDLDDFIPRGTKMTNTGLFLWIGSLKIQNFTDI